jgi:hypothetical protein
VSENEQQPTMYAIRPSDRAADQIEAEYQQESIQVVEQETHSD